MSSRNTAAVLVSLASAASCRAAGEPVQVMPGVWRIRLGSVERLTPLTYRSAPPRLEGLSRMSAIAESPIRRIEFQRGARGCSLALPMSEGEKFYGLGLSTKTFELSGRKAWSVPSDHPEEETNESHAPEPFYVSSKGYGVCVDTARYAAFSFGNTRTKAGGTPKVTVDVPAAQGVDVYIFGGPTALDAVRRYNLFSGGGAMPPLWGLGIAYRGKGDANSEEVLNLAKSFRETQMPCDIFGIEPGWQTQTYSCSFLWNRTKFPDPDGFIRQMHDLGYKMSFWEHPFTHPKSPIYEALKPYAGSHLVWNGLVPDFATQKGRRIYLGIQEQSLFLKGVDSVKIDEIDSQPFKADPWSYPDFAQFPSGLDGEQMHSLIGVLSQQTMMQPLTDRNLRTWGLARDSGALASSLPYTIYSDSYDHTCYLRGLVKMGFGSHLWVPEVRDAKNVPDLVRRVQTVILSPYAMINCWYMKLPPWLQTDARKSNAGEWMPEAQEATALVRKAFQLRMSLIPYLYSAFQSYRMNGTPVVRALALDFPMDPKTAGIDDQLMLGPSLMAAPFLNGASNRTVYLPQGVWYDFYTGQKMTGGRSIQVEMGLDQLPLYVKDNTLLPLADAVSQVRPSDVFKVRVAAYGTSPEPCTLIEDDGLTNNYAKGEQTTVRCTMVDGTLRVERSGRFRQHRYEIALAGH